MTDHKFTGPPVFAPPDQVEEILARTVRIETKLTKLLAHVGLNADGSAPAHEEPPKKPAYTRNNHPLP